MSQSFLAFGDILELHRKFLEISGSVNRIFELEELLDAAQSGISNLLSPNGCLYLAFLFFVYFHYFFLNNCLKRFSQILMVSSISFESFLF